MKTLEQIAKARELVIKEVKAGKAAPESAASIVTVLDWVADRPCIIPGVENPLSMLLREIEQSHKADTN